MYTRGRDETEIAATIAPVDAPAFLSLTTTQSPTQIAQMLMPTDSTPSTKKQIGGNTAEKINALR